MVPNIRGCLFRVLINVLYLLVDICGTDVTVLCDKEWQRTNQYVVLVPVWHVGDAIKTTVAIIVAVLNQVIRLDNPPSVGVDMIQLQYDLLRQFLSLDIIIIKLGDHAIGVDLSVGVPIIHAQVVENFDSIGASFDITFEIVLHDDINVRISSLEDQVGSSDHNAHID